MQPYRTIHNHKVFVNFNLALSSNTKNLNLNKKLKAKEILISSPSKQTEKKNASICFMNVELILIQMPNVPRYHIFLRL